jgi:hypothetical protein
VVDWLQCHSPDEAGVYRILPRMHGFFHLEGMLVAPRMEGYVASDAMVCVGPLNADRLYTGTVFRWRGFCRPAGDVQCLWAVRTVY